MVSRNKKITVWLLYILFKPLLFYIVYQYSPGFSHILSTEYLLFLILSVIVVFFPIHTEDSIIFLITGLSLAVFIEFGLFAEMVLTTYAVIILMIKSNIKKDEHFRYPLNLLIFQVLSVLSALAYYGVKPIVPFGTIGGYCIVSMIVYMLTHLLGNQLFLYGAGKYYFKDKKVELFDDNFPFVLMSSLFTIPLTFILVYLSSELGRLGILIGALPFVFVTVGLNSYYNSRLNNKYLIKVNDLAQELTELKEIRLIFEKYLESLFDIFPVDGLSYFSVTSDNSLFRRGLYTEKSGSMEFEESFELSDESILKKALIHQEVLFFNRAEEWKCFCKQDLSYPAESALVIPVRQDKEVIGLILLSHRTKNMFDKMIVSMIKVVHQYFSIALDNAFEYEELEENSEKDFLTGLPNLKGFAKVLEQVSVEKKHKNVSLIVLDLDHFKQTNDTYGHQAGNEVLKQIADILATFADDKVSVARYGGEEFVVLLEDYGKKEAAYIAEQMRESIETTPFIAHESIQNKKAVSLKATASVGVATYPEDCAHLDELITLADKAMYIGSKQRGRNRVTVSYEGRFINADKNCFH
ncbi:MAG: GGDEF domain-containing protein [Alkalibacterium sp.]|nr:GGDEF domain-containing protein [Alkalibacterium sp.]